MTILRADGWNVKPGRIQDVRQYASEMKPLIRKHGGSSPRLMRVAIGGTSTGLVYGEFVVEDMESHGRVTAGLLADDDFKELQESFGGPDGPTTSHTTLLVEILAEVGARTESVEGCVESIQSFRVPAWHQSDFVELVGELASFTDQHDARLRVLHGLTGENTGSLSFVAEFANMGAYGRFADEIWPQPAFRDLVGRLAALGEHTDGSLHAEIVV